MVRRERHLGRADEVEVLPLDAVDVVGRLAEEAGALHGARPHQRRRDHRGEPGGAGLVHRQVHQRQLEVGADAGQVVEAGAGDLGAAVDVDRAEDPAELDVVLRLEPLGGEVAGLADVLEHDEVVLAAGRGLLGGRVRDAHQDRAVVLLGLGLRGLGAPSPPPTASWCGRAAPASRRPAPAGSACRASSARPAAARTPRSRHGAAGRPPRAPRPRRPPTARAAPGQHGHGRGRRGARGDRSPRSCYRRRRPRIPARARGCTARRAGYWRRRCRQRDVRRRDPGSP